MTRSMTMILAGSAAVAALALSACSAGLNAQTAAQVPAVPGANVTVAAPGGQGTVSVRDVAVAYPGTAGYPAGAEAPLQIRIFNDSARPVEVTISSPAGTVELAGGDASPATPASPAASPDPAATASPAAEPTAQPAGPAKVTIGVGGYVVLDSAAGGQYAKLVGLKEALATGGSVPITFDFGDGVVIETVVPVTIPLSAYPREHATFTESEGH